MPAVALLAGSEAAEGTEQPVAAMTCLPTGSPRWP